MEKKYKIEIFSRDFPGCYPEDIHAEIQRHLHNLGYEKIDYEPPSYSQPGAFYTTSGSLAQKIVKAVNGLDKLCAKYSRVKPKSRR